MNYVISVCHNGVSYFLQRKNVFTNDKHFMRIYKSKAIAERAYKRLNHIYLCNGNTLVSPFGSDEIIISKFESVIVPVPM